MQEKCSNLGRVVLGTAALGMGYGFGANEKPSQDEVFRIFELARDVGVNNFDTAPAYGDAERLLGKYFGGRFGCGEQIWTKLSNLVIDDSLNKDALISVEKSLTHFSGQSIRFLQWHNWSSKAERNPYFLELWKLLSEDDRISNLGASTYGVDDAIAAVSSGLFDMVQIEWNILNQSVMNAIGELAQKNRVKIALRSVFLQGVLTPKGTNLPINLHSLREPRQRVLEVAARMGLSINALALRAALDHPLKPYVLVGPDRLIQFDEMVKHAQSSPLDENQLERVYALNETGNPAVDPRNWLK